MYSQLCAIVIELIDNILEHGYEHISIVINNSTLHLSHISISNCSADSSIIRESVTSNKSEESFLMQLLLCIVINIFLIIIQLIFLVRKTGIAREKSI